MNTFISKNQDVVGISIRFEIPVKGPPPHAVLYVENNKHLWHQLKNFSESAFENATALAFPSLDRLA